MQKNAKIVPRGRVAIELSLHFMQQARKRGVDLSILSAVEQYAQNATKGEELELSDGVTTVVLRIDEAGKNRVKAIAVTCWSGMRYSVKKEAKSFKTSWRENGLQ